MEQGLGALKRLCVWDAEFIVCLGKPLSHSSICLSGGQVSASFDWLYSSAHQQHVQHAPRMDSRAQWLWHPRLQGFKLTEHVHHQLLSALAVKSVAQARLIFDVSRTLQMSPSHVKMKGAADREGRGDPRCPFEGKKVHVREGNTTCDRIPCIVVCACVCVCVCACACACKVGIGST